MLPVSSGLYHCCILGCFELLDLIFVLDASGSVHRANFAKMLKFVKDYVTESDVEWGTVRIGVMTFSDEALPVFHLNAYRTREGMLAAIDTIKYTRGTTNTGQALRFLHSLMFTEEHGDRSNARNVAFLVTDGASNDAVYTMSEARQAKHKNINLYVMGIGDWLNEQEMNAVASYPYALHRFRLSSYDALDESFRLWIREVVCNSK